MVIVWFDLGMLLFRLFLRLFVCFVGWFGFDLICGCLICLYCYVAYLVFACCVLFVFSV